MAETVRIFVVEDDRSSIELARLSLMGWGMPHDLTLAATFEEATEAIDRFGEDPATAPHVIFLDSNLGHSRERHADGKDLLDKIKRAKLPSLVLASSADPITETGLNIPRTQDVGKGALSDIPGILIRFGLVSV